MYSVATSHGIYGQKKLRRKPASEAPSSSSDMGAPPQTPIDPFGTNRHNDLDLNRPLFSHRRCLREVKCWSGYPFSRIHSLAPLTGHTWAHNSCPLHRTTPMKCIFSGSVHMRWQWVHVRSACPISYNLLFYTQQAEQMKTKKKKTTSKGMWQRQNQLKGRKPPKKHATIYHTTR